AAMYAYSRRRAGQPLLVVRAALLFQVLGALLISIGERLTPWLPSNGISVACLWIMTFAFVPSVPRRVALAAYLAASMEPIGILQGAALRRRAMPSIEEMVFQFLANYLAATFALAGSLVMYRLATAAANARRLGSYRLVRRLGEGGM